MDIDNEFLRENETEETTEISDLSASYIEGKGLFYKTGVVAEMIGVSRDMTRHYIKSFSEYMHIEYTSGGQYLVPPEDIDLLKTIAHLAKNGKKIAEIKGILKEPDMRQLYNGKSDIESVIANMLLKNNQYLFSAIQKVLLESENQRTERYLELHHEDELEKLKLREEIESLKHIVQEQNKVIENYMQQQEEKIKQQEEILQKIAQQTEKKKHWWSL